MGPSLSLEGEGNTAFILDRTGHDFD